MWQYGIWTHCLQKNSSICFAWSTVYRCLNGEYSHNPTHIVLSFNFALFCFLYFNAQPLRCQMSQLGSKCWDRMNTYRNLGLLLGSITKWGRVSSRMLLLSTWKPPTQIYSMSHYCIFFNFYDICRMKTDRMDNLTWIVYSTGLPLLTQYSHPHQWYHLGLTHVKRPCCPFWFLAATEIEVRVHVFFVALCLCLMASLQVHPHGDEISEVWGLTVWRLSLWGHQVHRHSVWELHLPFYCLLQYR